MPPTEHLPAKHGTIRGCTVDLLHRQPEFHLCRIPQLTDGGKLAAAPIGQVTQFGVQPPDCTGQGLNRDGATFLAISSDSGEPVIQLRNQLCRQDPLLQVFLLGNTEQPAELDPPCAQESPQMGAQFRYGNPRTTVEDQGNGSVTCRSGPQEFPGNGIRVPGGGRHKQPQIGCRQELPGEHPVIVIDRVDVGSV